MSLKRKVFYIDPQSMSNLAKYDYYLLKNIDMPVNYFCSKYYDAAYHPGIIYKKIFSYNKLGSNWQKAISYVCSWLLILLNVIFIRPQVVHIQWFRIPIFDYVVVRFLQRIFRIKVVFTAHNILPHQGNENKNQTVFQKAYYAFDKIIVHSQSTKEELVQSFHVTPEKIAVINHGILPLDYDVRKYNESLHSYDEKYAFEGKIVFSALGYQNYYKGTDLLAKVWAETPELRENQCCVLIIKGKVNDSSIDLSVINGIDNVIFEPNRISNEEFGYILRHTDVYLLPYRDISQSGALMTVLTEHIPVLVTNVGGLAEPLLVAPVGWMLSQLSADHLRQALLDLINHPDKIKAIKNDTNSWDAVCRHYSWEHIGQQTQQLYESF